MKFTCIIAQANLLGFAIAQPHRKLDRHLLNKYADSVVTVTVWETVQAPEVTVLVDENGNAISQGIAATATPTPAAFSHPQTPAIAPTKPSPEEGPLPVTKAPTPVLETPATPSPATLASETSQASTSDSSVHSEAQGYGIGWSNYKGTVGDTSCKTMDDADNEWSQMADYDIVRVYGADCGEPGIALQLAKKYNKKVFMGVYWLDNRLSSEVQAIINEVESSGSGWDRIDTISIGNEDVHRREKTPGQIYDAVFTAKNQLRAAGYTGPVVHVDSQEAILANPDLCGERAGDYIAANVHPFFNAQTSADQAGDFVQKQIDLLKQCGAASHYRHSERRVRVTETGWPKNGDANGAAIPSKANQNVALDSIKSKIANDVIIFSAFNNYWMRDDSTTFNTEHYWGLLGD